ncbi:hypothetical protein FHX37_4174 [Haloactinospora alba]|uniref:Uncharacterized protein n=1 Tax=Haloactinospora alba TaxID=405555 RepID=A0A543NAH7_9ACTN|nr:hypothetical protein FHX37_4174 [Haloactinospora alba]
MAIQAAPTARVLPPTASGGAGPGEPVNGGVDAVETFGGTAPGHVSGPFVADRALVRGTWSAEGLPDYFLRGWPRSAHTPVGGPLPLSHHCWGAAPGVRYV